MRPSVTCIRCRIDVLTRVPSAAEAIRQANIDAWSDRANARGANGGARRVNRPPYADYQDAQKDNTHRFMCAIPFPWVMRQGQLCEGIVCSSCTSQEIFLPEDFAEHLLRCWPAKNRLDRIIQTV